MSNPIRIQCVVSSLLHHDDAVSTVSLKPLRRMPNFKPGQFLHLAIDPYDPTAGFWPESRVFSIASTSFDLEITIAYAVKGAFTKRMRQELIVGKEIWIRLPYGHFSMATSPDEEIVLVAGGTGIAPFISFISNEIHNPSGMLLRLIYGVRRPELFLFTDVIVQAMSKLNGFKIHAFCEDECYKKMPFSTDKGSLSIDRIWSAANDPFNAAFYIAGPIEMINIFKSGLTEKCVKPEKIRIDEWE